MADEIREHLRAAQSAESEGDKARAVAHLERAAALYREAGKLDRALQMLRQALRLDGGRRDLEGKILRLEAVPPPAESFEALEGGSSALEVELRRALEAMEAPAARPKRLIERGLNRADPALDAWCSFCCRPRAEVGELVAGPAGAFVCLGCVRESARLLGTELDVAPAPGSAAPVAAPAPAEQAVAARADAEARAAPRAKAAAQAAAGVLARPSSAAAPAVELLGQAEAAAALEQALALGLGWILLLGPEGSGKTTCLLALERQGLGHYVHAPGELPPSLSGKALLLDGLDAVEPELVEGLCARAAGLRAPVVLAFRGAVEAATLVLAGNGAELPLFSTQALRSATQERLPVEVAERIQAVAPFRALSAEPLRELARRLLAARFPSLALSEEAVEALAAEAARSPRGGHELKALIARVPPGAWTLKPSPGPSKARKKGGR